MKELSTVIHLHRIGVDEDIILFSNTFDFVPTTESSAGGTLYNCSQELVIESVTKTVYSLFSQPQSSVVTFRDNNGSDVEIGSTDIPAQVTIFPYLNSARLSLSCKMRESPYQ